MVSDGRLSGRVLTAKFAVLIDNLNVSVKWSVLITLYVRARNHEVLVGNEMLSSSETDGLIGLRVTPSARERLINVTHASPTSWVRR